MAPTLVLLAHPHLEHSRVHRGLLQALQQAGLPDLEVRDLYALYPDYVIDVPAEQEALSRARLVVWQHPMHWYGMPALMKLWVDEVLSFGWAYGPGGDQLRGKDLWLVTSTGGSVHAYSEGGYNRHPFEHFMPPYAQTADLCGMRFLPPKVLHSAQRATDAELQAFTQAYLGKLRSWPDWTLHLPLPEEFILPVSGSDRPPAAAGAE